jgi:transcriptional regulator GlxA family with amidase domain
MSSHTFVILAINQTLPSGLMGIADMLSLASLSQQHSPNSHNNEIELWRSKIITAGVDERDIVDGQGRAFKPDCALSDIDHCDGVLIPGFVPCANGMPPNQIINTVTQNWLQDQYTQGVLLGGSCSGAFVLGEAGLLNKRRCTTTWWLHHELKKRYSQADAAWEIS